MPDQDMSRLRHIPRATAGLVLLCASIALGGCWSYVSPEAQQRWQARQGRVTVTVFPVHVIRGPVVEQDAALARRLAALLGELGMAEAVVGTPSVEAPFQWGHNQAKMARSSAQAFAAHVEKASIGTQYALLVEILCNPAETEVVGVHFYLAEQSGLLAAGGLANSHWEDFKELQPRDRHGGYEVAARMIRRGWRRG
jgi:hypothetical protein